LAYSHFLFISSFALEAAGVSSRPWRAALITGNRKPIHSNTAIIRDKNSNLPHCSWSPWGPPHCQIHTGYEFCIPQLSSGLVSGKEQRGAAVHALMDGAYTWYYSLRLPKCWGELRSSLFCFVLNFYSEYSWEVYFCTEHNAGSVCTHLGKGSLRHRRSPGYVFQLH